MYHKTTHVVIQEVRDCIYFTRGKFPLIYLGCPIGHARNIKVHFVELIKKVHNKPKA